MRYFPERGSGPARQRQRTRVGIGGKSVWSANMAGASATESKTSKNRVELGTRVFSSFPRPVGIMEFHNGRIEEEFPAFISYEGGDSTVYAGQAYAKLRMVGPNMTAQHDSPESGIGRRYGIVGIQEYPDGGNADDGYPHDFVQVGILRNLSLTGEDNSNAATSYWQNNSSGGWVSHIATNHYFYNAPVSGTPERRLTVWGSANQVDVAGTLTKVSGTFDIEHPTVEGKRLRHSFIEGPQADLIYRGTCTLGSEPTSIDMDAEFNMTSGTWEALNCAPWSMVASSGHAVEWSFAGAELTITGPEGAVCNWMVIGERHDPHMKSEGCQISDDHGHIITEYVPEPMPDLIIPEN